MYIKPSPILLTSLRRSPDYIAKTMCSNFNKGAKVIIKTMWKLC